MTCACAPFVPHRRISVSTIRVSAETFADWGVDYLKYDYCDMASKPQHNTQNATQHNRY